MKTNYKIEGLTCGACVKLASNRIKKIAGVQEVDIDIKSGTLSITSDGELSVESLNESLADTEYKVKK